MRRKTIKYTLKIALLVFIACLSLKVIYHKVQKHYYLSLLM